MEMSLDARWTCSPDRRSFSLQRSTAQTTNGGSTSTSDNPRRKVREPSRNILRWCNFRRIRKLHVIRCMYETDRIRPLWKQAGTSGANASDVNLYNASMYGTNLTGADFSGAYMRHANLAHSGLSGVILIGADLFEADLTGVNLDNVCWDDSTRWPTYFDAIHAPRSCRTSEKPSPTAFLNLPIQSP